MKTIYATAMLLAALNFFLDAQPKTAPPGVAQWEVMLAAQEQRANLLSDEIKGLDSRIETRGDALINALAAIGDSKDSRTKVARMKEDTVEALSRNIRYYQTKRAGLEEELRRPTLNLTDEQRRRIIAAFNERIEKRVGQILEILKSLPTHQDYERYTPQGSNWIGPTYALNEDYLQNQRLTTIGTRLRREIEMGLRRSIARLEQSNRSLKAQLDAVPPSASSNNLTVEIVKNDALIAERHKQIDTILSFVTTPTRPIGQMEAIDFDRERNLTIAELREDFYTLFARYNALIPQVCAINTTRAAIAAAKAQTRKQIAPSQTRPAAATPSPGER